MCFALVALQQHPDYPFILAANRDEFFDRAASPFNVWAKHPDVVGGLDLSSQGSWLAINQNTLKFALVTNVREGKPQVGRRSRGLLIHDVVIDKGDVLNNLVSFEKDKADYAGFNILAGYLAEPVYYMSNRSDQKIKQLSSGYYGLSNASLNTPWPKVVKGLSIFKQLVNTSQTKQPDELTQQPLNLLHDGQKARPEDLPDTGIGQEKELWLSSVFIEPGFMNYGTRCSTVILMNKDKQIFCYERSYFSDNRYSDSECFFK